MESIIVLVLVGLAAQMIDGSLGMAYGVTSTTLLVANRIGPAIASASVHIAEVGTTLLSGAAHWRFGNLDWKVVAQLGIPGALGAFLGATALSNLSTEVARPWMAGILLALGMSLLVRFAARGTSRGREHLGFRARFLSPLGLVAGFVDATGGGGWGPVATPTLLVAGRTEPRKVIGSVSASEFLVSLAASIGFLIGLTGEGVDWRIAAALLAGGALAAPFAAWLVRKVVPRILGTAVGAVIVLTNSRTLMNEANVASPARTVTYVALLALSVGAVTLAVRGHRKEIAAATAENTAA
ncbi:MAG TPA: sulfite exporter TauE/SafE family protein [Acidimicrobiia bacterium]|nr:sulfite exporter TauE/SafE family protein [Acidimicrobiia bacterium]